MESITDEELVERYRSSAPSLKSREFLDELFRRQQRRVALWCYPLTGDREWAADLAQEVFVKAFRNLDSFRGNSKFSTWLYTIARHHCFNEINSRSSEPRMMDEELLAFVATREDDPYRRMERENTAETVNKVLRDALSEEEVQVMALHFGEDLPLDAITRMLKLENASGAKAYIVSAKRKLKAVADRWKAQLRPEGS